MRLVTLGDTSTGKTSITVAATAISDGRGGTDESALSKYQLTEKPSTIGASFRTYETLVESHTFNSGLALSTDSPQSEQTQTFYKIRLEIWDTAGQERYKCVAPMYYREAKIILMVYAIDNIISFESLRGWMGQINSMPIRPILFLIGNKSDMEDQRAVTREQAEKFAKEYAMVFYETSAKSCDNIIKVFNEAARLAFENLSQLEPFNKDYIVTLNNNPSQSYCQC